MAAPIIKILDSVHCKANKEARELILPPLKYKSTRWVRIGGRKVPEIKTSHLVSGRNGSGGTFLTGLLPKVLAYKKNKKKIKTIGRSNNEIFPFLQDAKLKGITFREDQKEVFEIVKKKQRGIITFPTGSGKTIIACGIISMFLPCRVLFLCHTIDLIKQTEKDFNSFFNKDHVFVFGGGNKASWDKIKDSSESIVLATIQTFSNINPKQYSTFFDVVIIDEVHHVTSLESQYGMVIQNNLSPIKYGLTATMPTSQKGVLINEGLIGQIISELTINEGVDKNIIAKPTIKFLSVPFQDKIKIACQNNYNDFYTLGIVKNRTRNILIVKEVIENLKKEESTLIIIEKTNHGSILKRMLKKKKIKVEFVYGKTLKEDRNKIKNDLQRKKIKTVICSRVWKEGINIPSLNNIINAFGLSSEISTLQSIGRGLRVDKNKKTLCFVDFLDPYQFLSQHAILRIQTYKKYGWI